MLTYKPRDRITAREALEDKWIQENVQTNKLDTKTLENLSVFTSKNKMRNAILTFMATQMTT